jgi:two-component system sensor histidine kinase and response regulator WspE
VNELVEIFREEVDANLKEATRLALALEQGEPERADTEALMRVFHTLKGASRAIGFDQEKQVSHLLEDVYHDLLDGRAEPRDELVDLSLAAIDLIRASVQARLAEQALPDPSAFEARVHAYRTGDGADVSPEAARSQPSLNAQTGPSAMRGSTLEATSAVAATSAPAPAPSAEADASASIEDLLADGLDLMGIFHTEAEGHLLEAHAQLDDPATVRSDLRRVFHTLKGAARAIGCDPIRVVAAAVEDLFCGDETEVELPATSEQRTAASCALGWIKTILEALLDGRASPDSTPLLDHLARVQAGTSDSDCPDPPQDAATAFAFASVSKGSPVHTPNPNPNSAPDHAPAPSVGGDPNVETATDPQPAQPNRPEPEVATAPSAASTHPSPLEAGTEAASAAVLPPVIEPAPSAEPVRLRTEVRSLRGRASVGYEQLDRMQRLSGELTVAVGALSSQRERMAALTRQLARTSSFLSRLLSEDGDPETLLESLRVRLAQIEETGSGLNRLSDGYDRLDGRLQHLVDGLADEVTQARLVPLSDLLDDYPRMVRDLGRELGKRIDLQIEGAENRIDRAVLEQLRNPMLHLVRNAIDHGIEGAAARQDAEKPAAGRLYIEARQLGSMMRIRLADDGAGIDHAKLMRTVVDRGHTTEDLWRAMALEERMQFLFLPGLSTADQVSTTSGRGFGLDIVKTVLDEVGGQVAVHSETGRGTMFELRVPLTLALTRCLLVVGGRHPLFGIQRYAVPMNEIARVHRLDLDWLREIQGRIAARVDGETLFLHRLDDLLGLQPLRRDLVNQNLIVLGEADDHCGLLVDEVSDELDLVSRPLDPRLGKVRDVAALALLDDGGLALILDVPDLLERMREGAGGVRRSPPRSAPSSTPVFGRPKLGAHAEVRMDDADSAQPDAAPRLLVVEDSVTVREVERHFLEQAGYQVTTAVNGIDGLNKARAGDFQMMITDIDMPRMNGIELISTLRGMERFRALPIVVVSYKDRSEDKEKALEAGADRYVTKSQFDTDVMLAIVADLLQHP